MKVYLAGFNVDTEVLRQLEEKGGKRTDITPEVLSAAYARISRDPRPINEIRKTEGKRWISLASLMKPLSLRWGTTP